MSEETLFPRIRFNGFLNGWNKYRLEDIFKNISSGKSQSNTSDPIFPLYGSTGIIGKTSNPDYMGDKILIARVGANTGYVHFASGKYGITDNTLVLDEYDENKTDIYFHYKHLSNYNFQKIIIGSGRPLITGRDLKRIIINSPIFPEQQKIGNLFEKLDKAISLQQQVVDTTKKYKQSMLQKMFPKKGEKVPEIRFEEFTDKWMIKKIRDIAEVVGGGTPNTKVNEYWNGTIDWFSPSEIGDSFFVSESKKKITNKGLQKSSAKLLPPNKTILLTSRATIGRMAILTKEAATNQGFQSLIINKLTDTYFIFSMQNKIKKEAIRLSNGSTFLEISGKEVENIKISIPSLEEQQKIGSFFKTLDKKIEQEEKKLEAYKEIKKALMQRMFV